MLEFLKFQRCHLLFVVNSQELLILHGFIITTIIALTRYAFISTLLLLVEFLLLQLASTQQLLLSFHKLASYLFSA